MIRLIGLKNVYKSKRLIHEEENNDIPLLVNDDRFRYCLPLKFNCRDEKCQSEILLKNVVIETVSSCKRSFLLYKTVRFYSSSYLLIKQFCRLAEINYHLLHVQIQTVQCNHGLTLMLYKMQWYLRCEKQLRSITMVG